MTLYNSGRPRDRSHYEQFRGYHDAFYRHVEPTSVTPFSPPALERALHGVLIIASRQIAGWSSPRAIDLKDETFKHFLAFLRKRVESIDPEHLMEFDSLLERRLQEWTTRLPEQWGDVTGKSDQRTLMWPAGLPVPYDYAESWQTPTSLRNVDVECGVQVIPYYPGSKVAGAHEQ